MGRPAGLNPRGVHYTGGVHSLRLGVC